jgi:hypothetical protein
MENTSMTKVEKMVENLLVSMAIQDAINQSALQLNPLEKEAIDKLIIQMASCFKPAEA